MFVSCFCCLFVILITKNFARGLRRCDLGPVLRPGRDGSVTKQP
ncbi:hypothetical protein KP13_31758 [Klebsiella pneumoniae subsp. pneumoniae Kp13]|nr:hypothetical protein KP13_31758 [Klebsiella pneumoniae subsp. pneumoniae Kp13]